MLKQTINILSVLPLWAFQKGLIGGIGFVKKNVEKEIGPINVKILISLMFINMGLTNVKIKEVLYFLAFFVWQILAFLIQD